MSATLIERTHAYFLDRCGISFDTLTAPIEAGMPSGRSVRGQAPYQAIRSARDADDASLPLGAWECELRRADWDKVTCVAVDTLAHQSKDLQIAAWMLEARIHKDSFEGIAPCTLLLQALCEQYWDDLHPQADGDDMEYRANVIAWIDRKLVPVLRMTSLTGIGTERGFCWADWEQARRKEGAKHDAPDGPSCDEVLAAMSATPLDAHAHRHAMLGDALEAIGALSRILDERLGLEAPSLLELSGLLERIRTFIDVELHRRGHDSGLSAPAPTVEAAAAPLPAPALSVDALSEELVRDRARAYATLDQVAEYLMRIEPHSPVPYLVRRAIEWGGLNTAQLYEELFLKLGGQLSIFDMLGIEQQTAEPPQR